MPINAVEFIKMLGIGKKGKKPAGPTMGVSAENNVNLGTAGDPRIHTSPTLSMTPMQAPPGAPAGGGGADGAAWLAMALSALGGGPDRNAYVAPFDAAEQRARGAHAAAVPQIAATYDQMRAGLGQGQQVVDRDAAQARAQMQAVQGALQGQLAQNAAPVMADLASQGNTPALGGLLGGAQAQIGTGQAQLSQQAAAQQALSGNMQAASTASHQSRLADSQLAQGAATSSSQNTLNAVLAQLDAKKASALQQYAQDSQSHGSRVAQTKLQAMERSEARREKEADPMRQIQLEQARMDLDERKADVAARNTPAGATGQSKREWENWHDGLSKSNPVSYDVLKSITDEHDDYATAVADLNKRIANKQVKTKGGKQLDATFLRDRLREVYEIHERMSREAEEEKEREAASRKRSTRR